MPDGEKGPPPRFVKWWEGLETVRQIALSLPPLAVLLFWVNRALFNQPLVRSIAYGVFEGGMASALLVIATANERKKRQ